MAARVRRSALRFAATVATTESGTVRIGSVRTSRASRPAPVKRRPRPTSHASTPGRTKSQRIGAANATLARHRLRWRREGAGRLRELSDAARGRDWIRRPTVDVPALRLRPHAAAGSDSERRARAVKRCPTCGQEVTQAFRPGERVRWLVRDRLPGIVVGDGGFEYGKARVEVLLDEAPFKDGNRHVQVYPHELERV